MPTEKEIPCCASRRRAVRFDIPQFVPVDCGSEPTFLLDLSEAGMALQAMEILEPDRTVRFTLVLPGTNVEVSGAARIVWSDRSGRVGMAFTGVPQAHRSHLTRWAVETQLRAPAVKPH